MQSKTDILRQFSLFSVPTGGIGSWLTENTHNDVFARLGRVDEEPLPAVQLNQLLVLGHEAPVGDGFFRYYWLQAPDEHPYDVHSVPEFSDVDLRSPGAITSLANLKWGLYRSRRSRRTAGISSRKWRASRMAIPLLPQVI